MSQQALDFLRIVAPTSFRCLTAINPDRKLVETATFAPDEEEATGAWIAERNGTANCYFHINPVMDRLTSKARREDIRSMSWLHVDIDPVAGADLVSEQQRILALAHEPPGDVPPPTLVVYSGGGYQFFWKLATEFMVSGDLSLAEEAARYNRQLEIVFGADSCHDISRLMRLAGTKNVPDARKRAKGRKVAMAAVAGYWADRVYDFGDFIPAPVKQSTTSGTSGFESQIGSMDNVARLASVDELPESVSDRVKVVIVQGTDPDDPNKHPSRSEWLFYVVCELVRAGCSDEVIYSVITDPDFAISASVVDKGQRMQAYALHQILRAKDNAENPHLMRLNEKHAVIGNMGGKCRVIEEVYDPALLRPRISRQSFEDFRNRYMNVYIEVGRDKKGPVNKPLGHWWLGHERRKQYESIVFSPDREVPGAYNLWRGFAYDAKPGDCSLYLEHMMHNICGGRQDYFDYLFAWMAMAVQFPARPGETAIVLRGRQGTGKTFFAKKFGALFGRHFLTVSNAHHITGNFNQHLRDCVVLLGDEAFYAGDKKHESTLKQYVTDDQLMYEAKGVDSEMGPNYLHIIMASNSQWVVPAGAEERRFFVLDVADSQIQKSSYFAAIEEQMEGGGYSALLHLLRTFPIENSNLRTVPKTAALVDQKIYSLSQEDSWWLEKLADGRLLPHHDSWAREVSKDELFSNYVAYMQRLRRNFVVGPAILSRFLSRVAPGIGQSRRKYEVRDEWDGQIREHFGAVYTIPSLQQCREHFEHNFGSSLGQWDLTGGPELV